MAVDPVLPASWAMGDLAAARDQFLAGQGAPAGVREVIAESWRRSQGYGLDPRQLPPQVVDDDTLRAARERARPLLEAAEPLLAQAHHALADTSHILALADDHGRILRALYGPGLSEADLAETQLLEGCSWHERDIGSNGVGTALEAGQAVILIGPEHFQQAYVGWTCIGVPIRAADGDVVGVFDLSVPNAQVNIHTWGWTLSIAQQIEARLRSVAPSRPVVPDLEDPFATVRGVFDLLLSQLGLGPTHAATLEAAREALAQAERQLAAAVAAVRASEQRARRELSEIGAIYDTAPVGLAVVDRDLRLVRINARLAEIHGFTAEEIVGRTIAEVAPSFARAVEPRLREVLSTGEPIRGESFSAETAAGEVRHFVDHYVPLRGADGRTSAINVVMEDVTRQRDTAEELRRLYEEATRAVRERDRIAAMVGHDLRSPLLALDIARRGLASGRSSEASLAANVSLVEHSVDQMRRLIRDLTDTHAMERGALRVEVAPLAPSSLLGACVSMQRPLAEAREIALHSRCADDLPLVAADEPRILQVLANLVGNALRFSAPGGRIRLVVEAVDGEVRFSVADDGPGLSAEEIDWAFEPFWQGRRPSGNEGLGLAICRRIVAAHGGRIWIESAPGAGAEVIFSLPIAAPSG